MKILLVHPVRSTFIVQDAALMAERHQVNELHFSGPGDLPRLWCQLLLCDLVLCWFGKLHAFYAVLFSKLLGKKVIVVAGGDDVACAPEINYGMFVYWWKKWCPLFVSHYADLILSVSDFNWREIIENAKADPVKVKQIYHGFDAGKFQPIPDVRREQLVITVGGVDWERLERKGYERFVRSAAYLPDTRFVVIGKWHDDAIDYLRSLAPANVTLIGQVTDTDLLRWFTRAKVYVQVSWHEAFGCSLAEAMLCECVPVVSRRAALPEVVGDCGFYVDELTPEAVAVQIEKALVSDLGQRARERIMREFPLEKRKKKLLQAIEELQER